MSFSNRYNKVRKFEIETTGEFQYKTMEELFKENGADYIYSLKGVYINNKSKYGKSPVLATDAYFVNAPSHMLDVARDILEDEEAIQLINNGKVGFKIYSYVSEKYNKTCFGIEFIDM